MKKLFSLILIVCCSYVAFASAEVENLLQKIKQTNDPQQKSELYNSLLLNLTRSDKALMPEKFREAMRHAQSTANLEAQANYCISYGMYWYFSGKMDSALKYYLDAVRMAEKESNAKLRSRALHELGVFYRRNGMLEEAGRALNESVELSRKMNDTDGTARSLNSLGVWQETTKQYALAMSSYEESLQLYQQLSSKLGASYSLTNIGLLAVQQKNYGLAKRSLLESLKLRLALQDSNATAMSLMDLAEFYQAIGNTDSAMSYAEQSLLLAKKTQYIDLQRHALLFMAESFERANEPAKALAYFRSHAELKDSIFNEQKSEQIAEMQTRFETEKKEQEIALQEIEIQQRNYLLIGLILLVAIAAAFAYVFYSRKQLMLRNNFQQEIIKQQDLNTRAIITAEENERKRIATELHDGIGQLFSAVKLNLSNLFTKVPLENSQVQNLADKTIALVDESCIELRSISHNMMPNVLLKKGLTAALRDFIEKIDAEQLRVQLDAVGLKEGIDQNTETVLYRVIQELVNNVIKHSQANQLFIQIDLSENEIRIHIEDNGIGFVVEDAKNKGGLGLANVMTRIEFLKGSVEWDSSPGRGSLVSVFVPLN